MRTGRTEVKNARYSLGRMSYLDYKKKIEFGEDEYNEIEKLCTDLGIDWSTSPWDNDSVDFLNNYALKWVKIPSALIKDLEYVEYVGNHFYPCYIIYRCLHT